LTTNPSLALPLTTTAYILCPIHAGIGFLVFPCSPPEECTFSFPTQDEDSFFFAAIFFLLFPLVPPSQYASKGSSLRTGRNPSFLCHCKEAFAPFATRASNSILFLLAAQLRFLIFWSFTSSSLSPNAYFLSIFLCEDRVPTIPATH